MAWWMWVLGGLGLLAAEMATPGGFFAIFFGFSAILVGALGALGLSGAPWVDWLLFSVFSILGVLVFRKPLMRRFGMSGGHKTVDRMARSRGPETRSSSRRTCRTWARCSPWP